MRILKTRWFARFSQRVRIEDKALCQAILRAESGLIGAELGASIIKLRVARAGQGRSGGYRVLVAYRRGHRAVFVYGFAKNELDNIDDTQLLTLREIAAEWLDMAPKRLEQALMEGRAEEVYCGRERESTDEGSA